MKLYTISILPLLIFLSISLFVEVIPSTAYWNDIVKIKITATPGDTCGVEIKNPRNTQVFVKQLNIGASGYNETSWQVPVGAPVGEYKVYVSCRATGSTSKTFTVKSIKPVGGIVVAGFSLRFLAAILFALFSIAITIALKIKEKQ